MKNHESAISYAEDGLWQWASREGGHGQSCPCLVCADTRVAVGMKRRLTEIERQLGIRPAVPNPKPARTVAVSVYRPVWLTVVSQVAS